MRVKLDYGKSGLEVTVPDQNPVGILGCGRSRHYQMPTRR